MKIKIKTYMWAEGMPSRVENKNSLVNTANKYNPCNNVYRESSDELISLCMHKVAKK
jgi:hypothetical protein